MADAYTDSAATITEEATSPPIGHQLKRALSVTDLLNKKYKLFEFDGEWYEAFGQPEARGIWFVWGNSGNGKTTFVLMLIKYLAGFARVAYNSLEEGATHTMQEAFLRVGMEEVGRMVVLLDGEPLADMEKRMQRSKSPDVYVVDSLQYAEMTYAEYKAFKERNRDKLVIFISHADGKLPEGRSAKKIMYDAGLKIWVEGYRALSKGRYIGPNGGTFTIWEEGADKYWNKT